ARLFDRAVHDLLGDRPLPVIHQAGNKLADDGVTITGVRHDLPLFRSSATRHVSAPRSAVRLLRTLRAVLRTALASVRHTLGIQRAANGVIANTGKVLDAATTYQHHGVLLEIVALARNVARHLVSVGETNPCD